MTIGVEGYVTCETLNKEINKEEDEKEKGTVISFAQKVNEAWYLYCCSYIKKWNIMHVSVMNEIEIWVGYLLFVRER